MAFLGSRHHSQSHSSSISPPVADGTSQAETIPLPDNSSWPQKLLQVGFDHNQDQTYPTEAREKNGGRDKQMTQTCLTGIDGKG